MALAPGWGKGRTVQGGRNADQGYKDDVREHTDEFDVLLGMLNEFNNDLNDVITSVVRGGWRRIGLRAGQTRVSRRR